MMILIFAGQFLLRLKSSHILLNLFFPFSILVNHRPLHRIIVAFTLEAVGESFLFISKAGHEPAKIRDALMGGFPQQRSSSTKVIE